MTYSQRGASQAGASSDIASLEHAIGELNDRVTGLQIEMSKSQSKSDEQLTDLRAEMQQARNELDRLQDELAAYED